MGQVVLELTQADDQPSSSLILMMIWTGFHHIAFVIKGMKDKIAMLEANGMPLLQKREYTGGRYAYHDANDALKMVLELLEND